MRDIAKQTAVALGAVAALAVTGPPARGAETAGQVLAVRREAFVLRAEKSVPAAPEMPLEVKDGVQTGAQSRAKLFFRDDSILNLGEKSRVMVSEYLASPEKERSRSIYQLLDGSLKVVVGRSDLEVHTQTAVAAARGTAFLIWADKGAAQSCVMVLEGSVSLRNKDPKYPGEVVVPAGMMNCVPADGPPGRTTAQREDLLNKLLTGTFVLGGAGVEPLREIPPIYGPGKGGTGQPGGGSPGSIRPEDLLTPPGGQQPSAAVQAAPIVPPAPPPVTPPVVPPGPPPEEQQR